MGGWLQSEVLGSTGAVALIVVALVVFAEDALFVGFVLPGETAAILGGVVASQGGAPLWTMLVAVIGAAIIGDSVGYQVGRAFGPRLLESRLVRSRRGRIDEASDALRRRGGWAVLLGRWVAFFRAVMPALAGMSGMRYRVFLGFNALGGVLWGATFVLLGYFAGSAWASVERVGGRVALILVGVAALATAAIVVRHVRRARRPDGSGAG